MMPAPASATITDASADGESGPAVDAPVEDEASGSASVARDEARESVPSARLTGDTKPAESEADDDGDDADDEEEEEEEAVAWSFGAPRCACRCATSRRVCDSADNQNAIIDKKQVKRSEEG
jgi:hypothetical protein